MPSGGPRRRPLGGWPALLAAGGGSGKLAGLKPSRALVRLALRGNEVPTSRASARRLLERMESAGEIVLDFSSISAVGSAFADEIFRVFRRENPEVLLVRIGATAGVERVLRVAEGSGVGPQA